MVLKGPHAVSNFRQIDLYAIRNFIFWCLKRRYICDMYNLILPKFEILQNLCRTKSQKFIMKIQINVILFCDSIIARFFYIIKLRWFSTAQHHVTLHEQFVYYISIDRTSPSITLNVALTSAITSARWVTFRGYVDWLSFRCYFQPRQRCIRDASMMAISN